MALTVGTSAAVRIAVPAETLVDAQLPFGLWCYRVDRRTVLLGGALTDGGSVYAYVMQNMCGVSGQEDRRRIESDAAAVGPVSDKIVVLPFCVANDPQDGTQTLCAPSLVFRPKPPAVTSFEHSSKLCRCGIRAVMDLFGTILPRHIHCIS